LTAAHNEKVTVKQDTLRVHYETKLYCHRFDEVRYLNPVSPAGAAPEYFCNPELYARGREWYETLFEDATGKSAVGEGSTSYIKAHLFPGYRKELPGIFPMPG